MNVTLAHVVAALLLTAGTALVFLALWQAERLEQPPVTRRPALPETSKDRLPYREAA
jgi:hypothetical protein